MPSPRVVKAGSPAEAASVVEEKKTPLFDLKAKRENLVENLYLDLKVPRWIEPEIWVRYHPLPAPQLEKQLRARSESSDDESTLNLHADILAMACEGIYATLPGHPGDKFSLRLGDEYGRWTKFDPDIAENLLGVASNVSKKLEASFVARKLYLTDGDLIAAANEIAEWSSQESERADKDFSKP